MKILPRLTLRVLWLAMLVALSASHCCAQRLVASESETDPRVEMLLSKMTLEEKIDLLGGVGSFYIRSIPRLQIPRLGTADGPYGVRNDGPATVMAGGISLASSWDPALVERVGREIARDAQAKNKQFLLGPGVNIYRSPLNGRNFEYFGEDPFLGSKIAVGYIHGMQSEGICATVKHFLGNNSEFGRHTTDSVIDQRTLREIYLPIFEAAIKEAHVGALMDSYNLVNGEHMTQNRSFNVDLVKKEWAFRGMIMSDWDATYDSVAAANGGLDLEMPSGKFMNRDALLPALKAGTVSIATIDDKVRRILRTEVAFGWLDEDNRTPLSLYSQEGRQVAVQAAREGMVLLKNERKLLPLDKAKIKSIAIVGPDAYPAVPVGGGSAQVSAFHSVSFLEGLSDAVGDHSTVYYSRGLPTLKSVSNNTNFETEAKDGKPGLTVETYSNDSLSGSPVSTIVRPHLSLGVPPDFVTLSAVDFDTSDIPTESALSTRWTGFFTPTTAGTFDVFVQVGGFGDFGYRLYIDGKLVTDSWLYQKAAVEEKSVTFDVSPHKIVLEYRFGGRFGGPFLRAGIVKRDTWVDPEAIEFAKKADVVVLAVGFDPSTETEGMDRSFRLPPGQEELIRKVSTANPNAVVVITSGGGVDMSGWLRQVPGVLEAWYPGQEGGTALADILFGEVNPEGHLPVTFDERWEDNPSHDYYYPKQGTNQIPYGEGIFVGYRGYDHNRKKPLFPFGFGLSYTTFKYENLKIKPVECEAAIAPCYEADFTVRNTGSRPGATVAQLYISEPGAKVPRPEKELKGFVKVRLKPGEAQQVSVPLNFRSFSYWDVQEKAWHADADKFGVLVGSSSADIELKGEITLPRQVVQK
ncbi:MAG TPA: glycoside hydrolase family 3 C-terminal domain-containing protein [Candidatus Sulfotelmatobacter sp.]|nr:glycoside hydrolase family 3 C-terminal domain-containing protein [Candidatus Sulfotelmatobacter sp.]